MRKDMKALLKGERRGRVIRFQKCGQLKLCRLKPETNMAIMMCLVFYLYICLGGALFLLLEGQSNNNHSKKAFNQLVGKLNISRFNDVEKREIVEYCDNVYALERRKIPEHDNLWNFIEATNFAYQIITAQGTGQTARVLYTTAGKIAYVCFVLLGVPLAVLTLRATGQRLNIFVYSTIRFFSVKVFKRQLTPNIHVKALIFNVVLLLATVAMGTSIYMVTQGWSAVDSLVFATSLVFTIANSQEKLLNTFTEVNSNEDKLLRIMFNTHSFLAFTVLASVSWSTHLFTRHMRFKAQNENQARGNGDARNQCPWIEVTHGTQPPAGETDRESVC